MRVHLNALSGLAAILVWIGAAPTAAQQAGQQVVVQFDDSTIARLLLDVQATWRIEASPSGERTYRASAQGDLNFSVTADSCNQNEGCAGLIMFAVFPRIDAQNPARLDAFLNQVNDASPTVKAIRTPDGGVLLQSYINASFGISYANAQAQLLVFGENIVAVRQALGGYPATVDTR